MDVWIGGKAAIFELLKQMQWKIFTRQVKTSGWADGWIDECTDGGKTWFKGLLSPVQKVKNSIPVVLFSKQLSPLKSPSHSFHIAIKLVIF